MTTSLEHQQSEQFRVLDPPSLPSNPSFPKMTCLGGGGLGVGLVMFEAPDARARADSGGDRERRSQ